MFIFSTAQNLMAFYFGSTPDIKKRLIKHNSGQVASTKSYIPWTIIWYGAFTGKKAALNFELYLKSGSGKAFAYKRLIQSGVSRKMAGRGSPKLYA